MAQARSSVYAKFLKLSGWPGAFSYPGAALSGGRGGTGITGIPTRSHHDDGAALAVLPLHVYLSRAPHHQNIARCDGFGLEFGAPGNGRG